MKYGILNFLETSGLLQTCNGTALPLPSQGMRRRRSRRRKKKKKKN